MRTAEDDLAERYLPLARQLAGRFCFKCPVDYDETFSDAQLGLLNGIRSYREERQASLKTWLTWKIRSAMLDGLRRRDHLARSHRKIMAAAGEPAPYVLSLTAARGDDDELTFEKSLVSPIPSPAAVLEGKDELAALLRKLYPDERWLAVAVFVDEKLLQDIAAEMGLSPTRISQRVKKLRTRLREIAAAELAAG
jgi:RNA polymerase sigma factor (sigma-70 family)